MKDIVIYGAGGFGKEIACLINRINEKEPQWKLLGFLDDKLERDVKISHFGKVLGNLDFLNKSKNKLSVVIAVGSGSVIRKIVSNISNNNIDFPNIIDPTLKVRDLVTFKLGKGNIIQSSCTFSCDVNIGDFNVFNGSVALGHDVSIGNYNVFMPATRISGEVKIEHDNFFGVGVIILQQIKIGHDIRIGAGSVLMTKPKNEKLYIGNPARIFKY